MEEAGNRPFTFTRLDPAQWKAALTTNAIERVNEECRRRIKTQAVLPCAETVPMLLCNLLASGQITMRKVDGWQTLNTRSNLCHLTSPPNQAQVKLVEGRRQVISTTFETQPCHAVIM